MEKKIVELNPNETQAVVGGIKLVASANYLATASYKPSSMTALSFADKPSRIEALLAKR
jgi:hypothetical protein